MKQLKHQQARSHEDIIKQSEHYYRLYARNSVDRISFENKWQTQFKKKNNFNDYYS